MNTTHTDCPVTSITISGENGTTTVQIDAAEWRRLSPVGKALAIHAAARATTGGKPFSILAESRD
jgi:hypothetical protein